MTVCIPSYKNRKNNLLYRLQDLGNREIIAFIYEDDFYESGYDQLDLSKCKVVMVPKEYHTIQKMRRFIQNYMGNQVYWTIDDDIIIEEKVLKDVEDCFDESIAILAPMNIIFWKTRIPQKYPIQAILFNGTLLAKKKISYSGMPIHEDIEICKKCDKKHLDYGIITNLFYSMIDCETTVQDHELLRANTRRIYPNA